MDLILQPDPPYLVTQGLFLKLLEGGISAGIRLVADATDGALQFPGVPVDQRRPCLRPRPITIYADQAKSRDRNCRISYAPDTVGLICLDRAPDTTKVIPSSNV